MSGINIDWKALDELPKNIIEAVSLHFEDQRKPGEGLNLPLTSETEIRRGGAAARGIR